MLAQDLSQQPAKPSVASTEQAAQVPRKLQLNASQALTNHLSFLRFAVFSKFVRIFFSSPCKVVVTVIRATAKPRSAFSAHLGKLSITFKFASTQETHEPSKQTSPPKVTTQEGICPAKTDTWSICSPVPIGIAFPWL